MTLIIKKGRYNTDLRYEKIGEKICKKREKTLEK